METENRQGTKTTLVLGGTSKTGRRVVKQLEARGLPVRVGSRSGETPFDWEDRSTWAPVLEGVGSAFISHYLDALPGAAEAVGAFAELAVAKGVRRQVLQGGRGEPESERVEAAARDSGAELTILRSTWFAQNFSEDYWAEGILNGELALPAGEVPEPFVDADDIADVAVAALTEDGHAGELYELTGPRLLTFAEAIDEIAKAAGREIRFVPVTIDEFASEAAEQGAPWAASRRTSETTRARPLQPAFGAMPGMASRERRTLRRDAGYGARMRAYRRRLLRFLQFRDARAQAAADGGGNRRDAVDQYPGRPPRLHDGAVRDGCGLPRTLCLGRDLLRRMDHDAGARRRRSLSHRHHRGDDGLQRPAQQQPREA